MPHLAFLMDFPKFKHTAQLLKFRNNQIINIVIAKVVTLSVFSCCYKGNFSWKQAYNLKIYLHKYSNTIPEISDHEINAFLAHFMYIPVA